jgi:hypothetical protein
MTDTTYTPAAVSRLLNAVLHPETVEGWMFEDAQHAPDCMIWQIDAAADRGDGFPEPEDVACTCWVCNPAHGPEWTPEAFAAGDPDECNVPTPPVSEQDDGRNSRPSQY